MRQFGAEPLAGFQRDIMAEKAAHAAAGDGTGNRRQQPGKDTQQAGFAAAIGAFKMQRAARLDPRRHGFEQQPVAALAGQIGQVERLGKHAADASDLAAACHPGMTAGDKRRYAPGMADPTPPVPDSAAPKKRPSMPNALKLAVDFGPLLIFFAANKFGGVFTATAAFMVATIAAMAISWWKTRHIPPMLLFTGLIVTVFGGLTLWLQDAIFIKLKPTLIYGMFAGILLFGLATRRPYLKLVMGEALPTLDDRGWTKLTRNWALFFIALMAANEVARQVLTTDQWINFKVWGVTSATLLFAIAQVPLMKRHGLNLEA